MAEMNEPKKSPGYPPCFWMISSTNSSRICRAKGSISIASNPSFTFVDVDAANHLEKREAKI
jgi:hypothetical protein